MANDRSTGHDAALARADALCQILATEPTEAFVAEAAALLKPLRDAREFPAYAIWPSTSRGIAPTSRSCPGCMPRH
ncbi:hypothetical protein [Rubrivivax gelatinosus]|uniref:hypothetical protein n=1 Tax=Rubrivivax gelatinosus TaxID=28068 RepID=UPI0014042C61|nr:hypothetical protein [Rubrivivax gelatinosus]MBK1687774.1 hypothetical protein [Rubrivivax gelatinosus]